MTVKTVSNSKGDRQCHSRSLLLMPFDMPHTRMICY